MANKTPKYIFVTGGVLSGLGKGITAASLGNLLTRRGYKVNMQKFDQYINVDAGTLNPAEHGEVFVTDDGAEADLDLGHYERFLDIQLTGNSSVMTGEIYQSVINRERKGDYLGKTVQVIPHVTDEVKQRARLPFEKGDCDINIVEIGGTVGDNEGFHFVEAARQMLVDEGRDNIVYVHVVFLPYLKASDEVKTKPAQNSVRELRSIGIQPDVLIARTDHEVSPELVKKMSLYTNVAENSILPLPTLSSVYQVPQVMREATLDEVILDKLKLDSGKKPSEEWDKFAQHAMKEKEEVKIAMVGKYTSMLDTYASVVEALKAAAWQSDRDLTLRLVDAEEIEKDKNALKEELGDVDGVVVPGGFGLRGVEGIISAIGFARENKIPYLGLCYGMQLATIDFARHVAGIDQAISQEFIDDGKAGAENADKCVINIMEDQKLIEEKGGTMRLGGWDNVLKSGTLAQAAYGEENIRERHRHRYEFNNDFREQLEKAGLVISGTTPDEKLVEVVELKPEDHPWFVGVQFHPEFTSRPVKGHPLFNAFVKAAVDNA